MRSLGVVDDIEAVDLLLQLLDRSCEGLLIEPPEQGLVEALVLALRGRLARFSRDRLHSERGDVGGELPLPAPAVGVEGGTVVGEEALRHPMLRDALANDGQSALGGLSGRDVGSDGEAGMVVLELEDHALATTLEDVLGRVELPARVRCRVDEPAIRRARLFFRGSLRATPALRKIRANEATDGAVRPSATILSWTLIGP